MAPAPFRNVAHAVCTGRSTAAHSAVHMLGMFILVQVAPLLQQAVLMAGLTIVEKSLKSLHARSSRTCSGGAGHLLLLYSYHA